MIKSELLGEHIKRFDFNSYKRCKSNNAHHFPIGLWASWWLSSAAKTRGTVEEERRIYTDDSWKMADLIFIGKSGNRRGIVEVENSMGKFKNKLDTFSWFELKPKNKFDYSSKDAKFCILMMWAEVNKKGNYTKYDGYKCGLKVRGSIINEMKIKSQKSKMHWVAYITKWYPDNLTYLGYEIIIISKGKVSFSYDLKSKK